MQLSVSQDVNWSLSKVTAVPVLAVIMMAVILTNLPRLRRKDPVPLKEALIAIPLPIFFVFILIIAMIIQ